MIAKSAQNATSLLVALYLVAGCVVLAGILWAVSGLHRRLKKMAGELGLHYLPRGFLELPQVKGHFGDVEVTLTPRGNNRRSKGRGPQSVVEALIPCPLPYGFTLAREDWLFKLGKMLGGEEIELGDPMFDSSFKIYGEEVEGVKALLRNPIVRNALLAFMERYRGLSVADSRLSVIVNVYLDKAETARPVLTDVVNLARALASAQGMIMPPLNP